MYRKHGYELPPQNHTNFVNPTRSDDAAYDAMRDSGKKYALAPASLETVISQGLRYIDNLRMIMVKPLNEQHALKLASHLDSAIEQLIYHCIEFEREMK